MRQVSFDDFLEFDIRLGKVLEAQPLENSRKPAIRMRIDFGPEVGQKQSSAQIAEAYSAEALVGRWVLGVVNFPPRRIAGFKSEVLTLGIYSDDGKGPVILIAPDANPGLKPGDKLG